MAIAHLDPPGEPGGPPVARGLKGVVVAETELGEVKGVEGFYHYRQYSAIDVAAQCTFEDGWRLLIDGELSSGPGGERFRREVSALRGIDHEVRNLLPGLAAAGREGGELDALRSAISVVASAEGLVPTHDVAPGELRRQALRLSAVVPTVVTALHRVGQGLEPLDPRPELGHVANYLYMLKGAVPDPLVVRALERYLVLTLDHGFNASTFTARVVTSTGADIGSALVAAMGALSGPLHGGAPGRAIDTLDAIGSADRAEEWVREAILSGRRIMGFGHAVYRTEDPRARLLREVAQELGGQLVELAVEVESVVLRLLAELKPGQDLHTNVEYYAGVVMTACGIPRSLFTPTFACSRTVGWCAHVLEQASDNRLIRPVGRYVGPPAPAPLPSTSSAPHHPDQSPAG